MNLIFEAKCFADELRIVDETGLVRLIASVSAPANIVVVLSESQETNDGNTVATLDRLDAVESQIKGLGSGRIIKFANIKPGMWKIITSKGRVVSVNRDPANQ